MMRTVLIGDLLALATVRLVAGEAAAQQAIAETEAAHHHLLTTGRGHADWGNGSLMSRVGPAGAAFPARLDRAALLALADAARTLAAHAG